MAVRYDGTESNTTDLELASGNPASGGSQLGNLDRLIEWNYAAPPDGFERRRNEVIYTNYQHNRDPFTDHPEYVWSVFVNQTNNSQIAIAGTTVNADGSSTRNVDLGRVFVNAAVPAAQAFTLNKSGTNGTYFGVMTTGAATSSLSGRFNNMRTNQTDSKAISVGLSTSTSTAGLKSGAVTIDNLDITTGGGTGHGANDANDTFNVSLTVLDHATPSFDMASATTSLTHDFGSIVSGSASPSFRFDVFNLLSTAGYTANLDFDSVSGTGNTSVLTTDLAASSGALSIGAGLGHEFTANLNAGTPGSFSATYTLMLSDENLPGAQNKSLTLTLMGQILPSVLAGDYNNDGTVDAADYVLWRERLASNQPLQNETASPGVVDQQDYDAWRANFGSTVAGRGSLAGSNAVPEPQSLTLLVIGLLVGLHRRMRLTATSG